MHISIILLLNRYNLSTNIFHTLLMMICLSVIQVLWINLLIILLLFYALIINSLAPANLNPNDVTSPIDALFV